jgi:hypothetical protein
MGCWEDRIPRAAPVIIASLPSSGRYPPPTPRFVLAVREWIGREEAIGRKTERPNL